MSICKSTVVRALTMFAIAQSLGGCSSSPRFATRTPPPVATIEKKPADRPTESVSGSRNPTGRVLLTLDGVASYYADAYHGKQTSNGEVFDMNDLTAAHRTFPFGTKVRVTNLENKKLVVVRVNDRGPFVDGRIIDLSLAAAKELDIIRNGTARVRLEVLEWGDGK